MGTVSLDFPCHQVARNDATGLAIDKDDIHHLVTVVHLDLALGNLTAQG